MLVALLITALVLTSVFGVLHDALAARDRIHNLSQIQRTGPLLLDQIENDLRSLAPYDVAGRKVFQGRNGAIGGADADGFDFVAFRKATVEIEHRERLLRPELVELGYRIRQNPRESMFLELWRREDAHLDDEPFSGGSFTRLYDKITSFNVTYFGEPGSAARGEDRWSSDEVGHLPQRMLIELELEIEPRVEASDRPLDFSRRRSFRRIINFDPDLDRILLTDLRPRIPDVPKPDETASAAGPPGAGGGPGAPGGGGNAAGGILKGFGGGGAKGGGAFTGGGGKPPGMPGIPPKKP